MAALFSTDCRPLPGSDPPQVTAPFLLQTCRRDMGGGDLRMMTDLGAPITVKGRHRGGLRLAHTLQGAAIRERAARARHGRVGRYRGAPPRQPRTAAP